MHSNPRMAMLGEAMAILLQSPGHRHLFIADIEWALLPALTLGQFRVWRRPQPLPPEAIAAGAGAAGESFSVPMALATWAFVSPEVDARIASGNPRLSPMDWRSGDIAWLMDIICPQGGLDQCLAELKAKIFPGRPVKTMKPGPDGRLVAGLI